MTPGLAPYAPGEEMRPAMGRIWALYDGAYDPYGLTVPINTPLVMITELSSRPA